MSSRSHMLASVPAAELISVSAAVPSRERVTSDVDVAVRLKYTEVGSLRRRVANMIQREKLVGVASRPARRGGQSFIEYLLSDAHIEALRCGRHRAIRSLADLADHATTDPVTGCWLWNGAAAPYGSTRFRGRISSTHRIAWQLAFGSIGSGLCVCHRCDVPRCCNPEHLFLGTDADNMRDRDTKGRHASMRGNGPRSRITTEQAREIVASAESVAQLGRRFGISKVHASRIKRGMVRSHV